MSRTRLTLYPKTTRVGKSQHSITITEKLDGSNLGFFKVDGDLWIAQRNWVIKLSDLEENKSFLYRGLHGWLKEHGEDLLNRLHEGSGVFGEWIGMGSIKYGGSDIDGKFYIFAKANLNEDRTMSTNIYYERYLFNFPFVDQEIPPYMDVVPIVEKVHEYPSVSYLDMLYEEYTEKHPDRKVEGFIINDNNTIRKYVRYKGGKLQDHYVGKE